MTFVELLKAPKSFLRSLIKSVRRVFDFAEERKNRSVRFFKVLKAYRDGTPVQTIANNYQCSRGTVQRYARIAGLAKRDKKKVPRDVIIMAYKAKTPIKEIAKRYGISQALVSKIATEAGINRYTHR